MAAAPTTCLWRGLACHCAVEGSRLLGLCQQRSQRFGGWAGAWTTAPVSARTVSSPTHHAYAPIKTAVGLNTVISRPVGRTYGLCCPLERAYWQLAEGGIGTRSQPPRANPCLRLTSDYRSSPRITEGSSWIKSGTSSLSRDCWAIAGVCYTLGYCEKIVSITCIRRVDVSIYQYIGLDLSYVLQVGEQTCSKWVKQKQDIASQPHGA